MAATFQAPPGHSSQAEALVLAHLVDFKLTLSAPDADLKVCRRLRVHPRTRPTADGACGIGATPWG